MTEIKKIEGWQTTDGKIWEDEFEAEEHQRNLNFENFYSKKCIHSEEGCQVRFIDISQWLTTHKEEILKFLGYEV